MALIREERELFLAEPHVAALAVDAGEGRAPLTVPIWYAYEPGGEVLVMTGADSVKARRVRAAGRFSLMVDRVEPTIRYVTVEGPVTGTSEVDREAVTRMAARYLAPEKVEGYVDVALAEHGDQIIFHMTPEHWLSADLGTV
ncbi:pyridoxamine 5'-phosphate oxidase family protein [Streptomyces sp. SBT349]|uniref:pyridoxamine 5'-phosphate oxidase family protein n=1 Tax=Streptomyces sp. SBT349 TaxID=1580539 RepID=UPI00066E01AC|nr:pyridoxamine 5'-phosphate oxidase family protein [Streptomyces sp. SBT349]